MEKAFYPSLAKQNSILFTQKSEIRIVILSSLQQAEAIQLNAVPLDDYFILLCSPSVSL